MSENKFVFSPQLSFTPDSSGNSGVLCFEGEIGIRIANELKKALQDSLEIIHTCELDFSNITGIDLTGIQLIYSAFKTAESLGRKMVLNVKRSDIFDQAVKESGFSEVEWLKL